MTLLSIAAVSTGLRRAVDGKSVGQGGADEGT